MGMTTAERESVPRNSGSRGEIVRMEYEGNGEVIHLSVRCIASFSFESMN